LKDGKMEVSLTMALQSPICWIKGFIIDSSSPYY
jgi:hypothetical protein